MGMGTSDFAANIRPVDHGRSYREAMTSRGGVPHADGEVQSQKPLRLVTKLANAARGRVEVWGETVASRRAGR